MKSTVTVRQEAQHRQLTRYNTHNREEHSRHSA